MKEVVPIHNQRRSENCDSWRHEIREWNRTEMDRVLYRNLLIISEPEPLFIYLSKPKRYQNRYIRKSIFSFFIAVLRKKYYKQILL